MTLIDTSIWIDHLRVADAGLAARLLDGDVCCHPYVIGELACGTLRRRTEMIRLLRNLPQLAALNDAQVMDFIDEHRLMGRGLGWVDAHMLAAASTSATRLWTRDRRLLDAARQLGVAV